MTRLPGERWWFLCDACRHGQRAAITESRSLRDRLLVFTRCRHQHRQTRAGDVFVDEGVALEVAALRAAGVDTYSSCQGDGRFIMLRDYEHDADRAVAVLPTWTVERWVGNLGRLSAQGSGR